MAKKTKKNFEENLFISLSLSLKLFFYLNLFFYMTKKSMRFQLIAFPLISPDQLKSLNIDRLMMAK